MTPTQYDLIIIGAGSGGLNVAGFFSRLSLRVLLIDKADEYIGGDCLNTGCVPSKALIHVANTIHEGKSANQFLSHENTQQVDIKKITDYISSKQDFIREQENPNYLKNKGIEYRSGKAKFIDTKTITLNGEKLTAKKFIIATGSRPRTLLIPNDKSIKEFNNENIFSIDFLPKEFVFIGGGPINCELGQAFSRLGSKVTILHTGERILEKEPLEASIAVQKAFSKESITVVTNVRITSIADKKITYTTKEKVTPLELHADALFVGIGRELVIDTLDLEKADVKLHETKTRLIVDDHLRTTNPNIYVVGDVAGNFQFTHAAEMHAKIVIGNILSPFKKKFDAKHIAWVTYTSPEVATFGIDEKKAKELGYETITTTFEHEDRAIVDENQDGFSTLYIDTKGYIHGGTMVAKNAGELSQELVLAMASRIPLSQIFNKVYPYPTAGRINRKIAGEWMSRKLTDSTSKILRTLFTLMNH